MTTTELKGPREGNHAQKPPRSEEMSPTLSIPDHELIRCIGYGSYGEVWLAKNLMGVFRAIKIIYRRRFANERPFERELSGIKKFEPISRLHEGLIDVLHVGQNEAEGCFYYVMELGDDQVSGQNINPDNYSPKTLAKTISQNGHLSVEECLRFGLALTDSLADLHKHGLVHRDIKPSNIIFVDGIPKLADIGLVTEANQTASFVGTEGFIPPEGPGTVQADIFGLGKVLYEASSGKDRHHFPDLPPEFDLSRDHLTLLELNTVILKACSADKAKRYQNASEMRADLVVISDGKSVKRLRALERRWARLQKALVALALILVVLAALGYPAYHEWKSKLEERQRKMGSDVAYGNRAMDTGDLLGALPYFTDAMHIDTDKIESVSTHRLRIGSVLSQCPKLTYLALTGQRINHAEFSIDGSNLLFAVALGRAEIRQISSGNIYLHGFGQATGLANSSYSPDGKFVVTSSFDGSACIWNSATLQLVRTLPHPDRVCAASFSPDGHLVLTACRDGLLRLWDSETGELKKSIDNHGGRIFFARFSPDGRLIVSGAADSNVRFWEVASGKPFGKPMKHPKWATYASFSPDGQRLVTACDDHRARIWEVTTGRQVYPELNHRDVVKSAEYSPDGRRIVTASFDGTARLWLADTLLPIRFSSILRHGERVIHAGFSPDGSSVVTSCLDGSVRIWNLAGRTVGPPSEQLALCGDRTRFVSVSSNSIQIKETASRNAVSLPIANPSEIVKTQLSANGRFVVVTRQLKQKTERTNHRIEVWKVDAGRPVSTPIDIPMKFVGMVLSADGKKLILYGENQARVWDTENGPALSPVLTFSQKVESAFFSPSGEKFGIWTTNLVEVWDWKTMTQRYPPLAHLALVSHAEFSPDGSQIVTCCTDLQLTKCYAQVWDANSGRPVGTPLNHNDGVLFATFSPDGKTVATASEDFSASLWDVRSSKPIIPQLIHDDQVQSVAFSSDGKRVLTASSDKTFRIWSSETGTPLTPPMVHVDSLLRANFIDRDSHIVSSSEAGRSWVWTVPSESKPTKDLLEAANLLTAGTVPASDAFQPISSKSQEAIWKRLRAKYPAMFTVSNEETKAWHRYQAEECERAKQWEAAAFHLKILNQLDPGQLETNRRLRFAVAQSGSDTPQLSVTPPALRQ